MAVLPSSGSADAIGVEIVTVSDNAGIDSAKAGLAELDAESQAVSKSAAGVTGSTAKTSESLKSIGTTAAAAGRSLSTFVTVPIVGIGVASAKMAMDFQQKMELLATNANLPQKDIKGLSDAVLKLAPQVGAGPDKLAEAFYHIASAGNGIWSTAKMLDILKISAEGAAIGQANLDDTTYALTSTMASGIHGAENASQAMATLTAIVGAGDMRFQDLNAAIGTGFLGTAASFGISLASVGSALATLTDNGEHADAAATRLRMSWALMASPSHQATKMMTDLGVSSTDAAKAVDDANTVFAKTGLTTTRLATDLQQPNGMNVALKDIADHIKKAGLNAAETDAILAKAFGGGRTDAAILTMLQNLDRTDAKFKTINGTANDFGKKWAEQQQQAKQKWNEAWAGIEADMIRLGVVVMPTLSKAMDAIGRAVSAISDRFERLSASHKQTALWAAGLVAALGPLLLLVGGLATGIAALMTPVGAVIGVLAVLGGAAIHLRSHFAAWGKAIDGVWHSFTQWTPVIIVTQYIQQVLIPALRAIWGAIENNLRPSLEQLGKAFGRVWQAIEPAFTTSLKILAGLLGGLLLGALWALASGINIFIRVLGYLVAAFANVINWVSNLIAWFGNLVAGAYNAIRTVITIISNIVPATRDVIGIVVSIFAALGGRIINAMGGAGSWLYNTGRSIIMGLINGINGAIGSLESSVGHVASTVSHGISGALHSAHIPGFATGTNYAPGGWAMVGENGPERMYVPPGSQIKTNSQSSGMSNAGNSNTSVTIGTVVLNSQSAATEFFRQLNQDTMNLGKGLTAVQGSY